jgi:hypothetical protein
MVRMNIWNERRFNLRDIRKSTARTKVVRGELVGILSYEDELVWLNITITDLYVMLDVGMQENLFARRAIVIEAVVIQYGHEKAQL